MSDEGQVVNHARVCVWIARHTSTGENSSSGDCTRVTDQLGNFQFDHVKNGKYTLSAEKEEDGYGSGDARQYPITVSDADPLHVVTVRLGPQGGILTCLILDKATGKPIEPAKPSFTYRVIVGGSSLPMKSSVQVTLPADTDVNIKAIAEGYRDWVYADRSDPDRSTLRLAPGERRVVNIEMEPLPKQ